MGLDDRDYMRDRYRSRVGGTKWNHRAGRVEGTWFDSVNRALGYQRGRFSSRQASAGWPPRWLVFAAGMLIGLAATWYWAGRGWPVLDESAVVFPASGRVTVSRQLDPRTATSRMTVTAGRQNAVVQLFTADTDIHLLSLYVRHGESVTVPVPPGLFRMRLIEGYRWYGPARFFGPATRFETVRALQRFTRERGGGIDLRRSPAGTMHTRTEWRSPPPL